MLPHIKVDDPTLTGPPQKCFLLKLKNTDTCYFHYLTSFRVIKGALEIFGAIYSPSLNYQTLVLPPWGGSLRARAASLVRVTDTPCQDIPEANCEESSYFTSSTIECARCHSCCGQSESAFCQQVAILNANDVSNDDNQEVILVLKSIDTVFGKVCSHEMISSCPAFTSVLIDDLPEWNQYVADIILDILSKSESSSNTPTSPMSTSVMVLGHQGVGKSSFCCFLMNSLLTIFDKVCFLDTDLGQPLLTVPGLTSTHIVSRPLIGAPHSLIESSPLNSAPHQDLHCKELLSIFVGALSPEVNPRLYLTSIGQCTLTYAQLLSGALMIGESTKTESCDLNMSSPSFGRHLLAPYCNPSPLLMQRHAVPERLLNGDGSDPTLRERLLNAVSRFKRSYQNLVVGRNRTAIHRIDISDPSLDSRGKDKPAPSGSLIPTTPSEQAFIGSSSWQGPSVPLIINTHGWTSGLGWQLVEAIGALGWVTHPVELIKQEDWRNETLKRDTVHKMPPKSDMNGNFNGRPKKRKILDRGGNKSNDDGSVCPLTSSVPLQHDSSWGPIQNILDISNPFIDIIEQCCGRLLLGLHRIPNGIHLMRCAFDPSQKSTSFQSSQVHSDHLRWLRHMSLFNPAYRQAVHFPLTTPEEFFHGQCVSSAIYSHHLSVPPRLISLRLYDSTGAFRFCISCCDMSEASLKQLTLADALFTLTGSVVVCSSDPDLRQSPKRGHSREYPIWVSHKPWRFITLIWIHSVDVVNNRLIAYAPRYVSLNELAKANIISPGYRYDFNPLPERVHCEEVFPNEHVMTATMKPLSAVHLVESSKERSITRVIVSRMKPSDRYGDQSRAVVARPFANRDTGSGFIYCMWYGWPRITVGVLISVRPMTNIVPEEVSSLVRRHPCHEIDFSKPAVLIIVTGGTICMTYGGLSDSLKPAPLAERLTKLFGLESESLPSFEILEWKKLIDSSDINLEDWKRLCIDIEQNYYKYNGFVILHGTDTLAYTASALSFMLENLNKPVILTGSMLPMSHIQTDAKKNLAVALMIAASSQITEGRVGVDVTIDDQLLLVPSRRGFRTYTHLCMNIVVVTITPGFHSSLLRHLFASPTRPLAVILLLYGTGTAPMKDSSFLDTIQMGIRQNVEIVCLTQCPSGTCSLLTYENGAILYHLGVIEGKDMTPEAAFTKVAYLMGKGYSGESLRLLMERDLRGELTERPVKVTGQAYLTSQFPEAQKAGLVSSISSVLSLANSSDNRVTGPSHCTASTSQTEESIQSTDRVQVVDGDVKCSDTSSPVVQSLDNHFHVSDQILPASTMSPSSSPSTSLIVLPHENTFNELLGRLRHSAPDIHTETNATIHTMRATLDHFGHSHIDIPDYGTPSTVPFGDESLPLDSCSTHTGCNTRHV